MMLKKSARRQKDKLLLPFTMAIAIPIAIYHRHHRAFGILQYIFLSFCILMSLAAAQLGLKYDSTRREDSSR